MNKKRLSLVILAILIVFNFLIWATPSQAYTGSIGIFPALTNGPDHTTVSNFDVNTESQNPVWVTTNLNYVESIVIQTNPAIDSHLLIKEYPVGDTVAFSFIVNQPFQDALVSATIYFWGPDVDSLQVYHEHSGEPAELLNAYKIQPIQRNADDNVLWSFTTYSFSDFSTSYNFINSINNATNRQLPTMAIILLGLISFSTYFVLKTK